MRTFLATIAGLVTAIGSTKGFEILGNIIYPVKVEISDPTNIEEIQQIMFKVPVFTLILIIIAHVLGLLIGFIICRLIDKGTKAPLYYISGIMIMLALINILWIKHPMWYNIADIGALLIVSFFYIQTRVKTN